MPTQGIKSVCYMLSGFSRVQLFATLWPPLSIGILRPARFLCPQDSPGKNTGVGCHAQQGHPL